MIVTHRTTTNNNNKHKKMQLIPAAFHAMVMKKQSLPS